MHEGKSISCGFIEYKEILHQQWTTKMPGSATFVLKLFDKLFSLE